MVTVSELKVIAKQQGVKKYSTMNKAQLLRAVNVGAGSAPALPKTPKAKAKSPKAKSPKAKDSKAKALKAKAKALKAKKELRAKALAKKAKAAKKARKALVKNCPKTKVVRKSHVRKEHVRVLASGKKVTVKSVRVHKQCVKKGSGRPKGVKKC